MPKFANPTDYTGAQGSKTQTGQVRFATSAEAALGTADNLAISPATLDSAVDVLLPDATETIKGKIRIATDAEAIAGVNDTIAITPFSLGLVAIAGAPDWSEVTKGIVEKATTAEAQGLTDDVVGMTPLKTAQLLATPPAIGGTTPAAGTFTSLTASGGTVTLSSVAASVYDVTGAGVDLTLSSDAGRVIINGEEAASDAITIVTAAGGIDVDAALQINIATSQNAVNAVRVLASAGGIDIDAVGAATEDINITNTGGSVVIVATEDIADSIVINATTGGMDIIVDGAAAKDFDMSCTNGSVTITSGEAVADSMVLTSAGGLQAVVTGKIAITSSQNAADSIVLTSSNGGIDILTSASAAGEDIDIVATGSSVNITATENVADSIVISSSNGGIDITAASASAGEDIDITATGSSINLTSTENAALAIYAHANGGTSETIKVHADQGTGVASIDILSDVGGITLTAGLSSADAINIVASGVGGGIDIDAGTAGFIVDTTGAISLDAAAASNFTATGAFDLTINSTAGSIVITGAEAAVDAVQLNAMTAGGGIDINAGTGGITIDTGGAFSIDGVAASNVTTTGAGIDLTLSSVLGSVLIDSTENAALAIKLHANGGTSETIQLHSDQGTGVGSVNLLSDVGGLTFRATGLATADAINLEAPAGGIDVDAALQINITSSQDAGDAVRILASAGGIDVDAVGEAGQDIVITNTGGSISLISTEAVTDAIVLTSSNAAGGINATVGTGGFNIAGDLNLTSVATHMSMNGGAVTDFIGSLVLTAGTVTVANTNIATADRIFFSRTAVNASTALGELTYTIINATSFTVVSMGVTTATILVGDVSTFSYFIVKQT